MPAVSTAIAVAGVGLNLAGQRKQSKAAGEAADYEAQAAIGNARIAGRLAKDAIERGAVEEAKFRKGGERLTGEQRATIAKSGVVVDEGSALDIILDTAQLTEIDAQQLRANSRKESFGYDGDAANFRSTAAFASDRASSIAKAGTLGIASTILNTAGKFIKPTSSISTIDTSLLSV